LLWVGYSLAGSLLVLAFLLAMLKARLAHPLPVYGEIAAFTLTNQNNRVVTLGDLQGQVWVADIIFTRCPGPCLKMTRQMRDLQAALPSKSLARLVTLTTDPAFDSPAVLKAYAQRFDADPKRWMFLTGKPIELANLAGRSLKLTAIPKRPDQRESPADLFIHSTIFVLVDKHSRLRGIFETTGENIDPARVKMQILADIKRLERER
jgi:cytochrome oxidase Cu insertion factor (SCO1/SenC/PrrC family)